MVGDAAIRSLIQVLGKDYLQTIVSIRNLQLSVLCRELRGIIFQVFTGEDRMLHPDYKGYLTESMQRGEYFSPHLRPYILPINDSGVPYRDFAAEPDIVVQIKKIMNALYHAELALIEVENLDLDFNNKWGDVKKIWGPIIENAYEASYIFTHLDPALVSAFVPEGKLFLEFLSLVRKKADAIAEKDKASLVDELLSSLFAQTNIDAPGMAAQEAIQGLQNLQQQVTAYNAGQVTGVVIEQLGSNRKKLDFAFIANTFSGAPVCIDKITQLIRYYSHELAEVEPRINEQKIKALQDDAVNIIQGMEDLYHSNRLFMPFKILRYIGLLRHIIHVTNSIVEQVGFARESTQESLVKKLVYLKYELIQECVALSDKVEAYAMLRPGILSDPIMQSMDNLYQALTYYVEKVVDFSMYGEDLRVLNEQVFTYRRLEVIQERLDQAQAKKAICQEKQTVFDEFYNIICEYPATKLAKLPTQALQTVREHYRVLQELMFTFDPKIHERIVSALFPEQKPEQGWWEWSKETVSWLISREDTNTNSLLTLRADLQRILSSEQVSMDFRIQLESDLVKKLVNHTENTTVSWRADFMIHAVDERALCQLAKETPSEQHGGCHLLLLNQDEVAVSQVQVKQLLAHYERKHHEIDDACAAFQTLVTLCRRWPNTSLHTLGKETKAEMLAAYKIFQPWLYLFDAKKVFKGSSWDRQLLLALQFKPDRPDQNVYFFTDNLMASEASVLRCLKRQQDFYAQRSAQWEAFYNKKLVMALRQQPLLFLEHHDERAHYLLPRHYSKNIAEFRQSLLNLRHFFGEAMQQQLAIKVEAKSAWAWGQGSNPSGAEATAPYPEMEDRYQAYAQPRQVAAIKRLYNAMYYLESMVGQLEQLNIKSTKTIYVWHLLQFLKYLGQLKTACLALYADPYCEFLVSECMSKLSQISEQIKPELQPYQVDSKDIGTLKTPVRWNACWNIMNAFSLIPEHLEHKTISKIAPERLARRQVQAKQDVIDIQNIIASTDSYFKLFLETPTMIRLFFHLRHRIDRFSAATHQAAIENLAALDQELFFAILREADQWEIRMGLVPGALSGPLDAILNKFYQGLIQALDLNSEQEFALLFNHKRINKRLVMLNTDATELTQYVKYTSEKMESLATLNASVRTYRQSRFSGISEAEIAEALLQNMTFLQQCDREYQLKQEVIRLSRLLAVFAQPNVAEGMEEQWCSAWQKCQEFLVAEVPPGEVEPLSEPEQALQDKLVAVLRQKYPEKLPNWHMNHLVSVLAICVPQYEREIPLAEACQENNVFFEQLVQKYAQPEDRPRPIPRNLGGLLAYAEAMYQHEHSTKQLQKAILQDHQRYVETLRTQQEEEQARLRKIYIETNFTNLAKDITNRLTGLAYGEEAYQAHLAAFIREKQSQICANLDNESDICMTLRKRLHTTHQQFIRNHYREYAHLNAIMLSLENAAQYCLVQQQIVNRSGCSLYENSESLSKKTVCIQSLQRIGRQETLSVSDRIAQMRAQVQSLAVANTMTKTIHHSSNYSWLWFQQWCYYLLSLLNLHTPETQKLYQNLCKTVELDKKSIPLLPEQTFFSRKRPVALEEGPVLGAAPMSRIS
ncbi:MAG: hypothetical protein JJT82_07570 [Legionellaceae bacterium]|nr:hypothetical protein [Legionellaceae bacterium]